MEFKHVSVLYDKTISLLNLRAGGVYVDGTLGGGGHSYGILSNAENSRLIGIDRDIEAINAAKERLRCFDGRTEFVNRNFADIKDILESLNISQIDGAVLDLGVSSYQLDCADRGFSYMHDAPLDMRMNRNDAKSAFDVVNTYTADQLAKVFYEYGEEKWSKRIAQFIAEERQKSPVNTTLELVEIIKKAIPKAARADGGHPAKRVFQAIRIEVNGELKILEQALSDFADVLKPGGRLAVITFHSLEDRITKTVFSKLIKPCTCPPDFPVCVCGKKSVIKAVTRKPAIADANELEQNSRAKSAKLRVVEKI